jgi:NAD(P)-dependent dehydrogenase (short-subunit alcohol dehydrogenase family)
LATVLITGASSGIGAATAKVAASRGYSVALLGRRLSALESVCSDLAPVSGGTHRCVVCDVTDVVSAQSAIDFVCAEMDVPEALVTSAGVVYPASLAQTTPDIWNETIAVNLTGSFLIAQAAAGSMIGADKPGSIVFIGSEQSLIGVPNYCAYAATKAALVGLCRALAAELAPTIRVNLLCPGPVDTPMLEAEFELSGDSDKARADEVRRVPLGRIASAEETALAALWLLLDAPYATATVLSLDGGTTGAFSAC